MLEQAEVHSGGISSGVGEYIASWSQRTQYRRRASGLEFEETMSQVRNPGGDGAVMDQDGRHFELKGKRAEAYIHELARSTFLEDWCYPNPRLPNGKELCDLLVVFDDIAIVWQVKDLKLGKDGRYARGKVEKNLRQVIGARRRLLGCKSSLSLENPRRGREVFSPASLRRIILISALLGDEEDFYSMSEVLDGHQIHNVTRSSSAVLLAELDTIADFAEYFEAREDLITSTGRVIIEGGEEELLEHYLGHGRSFDELMATKHVIVGGGNWDAFTKSDCYKSRRAANKISYGWDSLLARVHEGGGEYEFIARELARPNRTMRRGLAQAFADAALKADADHEHNVVRRVISTPGVTFCFLFMAGNVPREARVLGLNNLCYVARGLNRENAKAVGIATEMRIGETNSYDYCLVEIENWTESDDAQMKAIQDQQKVLVDVKNFRWDVKEYPGL